MKATTGDYTAEMNDLKLAFALKLSEMEAKILEKPRWPHG